MEQPIVYSYSNFRRYLSDWHAWAQEQNPDLNKSEVSRQLGLPRTRSFFTDVLAGRKLTPTFVDRMVGLLGIDRDEARYFRILVRYNQADTPEDRELAFDQLTGMSRVQRTELEQASYRYYRHWWTGAVRAMLATGDFTDDPKPIAQILRPAVTPGQVKEAITTLLELGLVERDAQGILRQTTKMLATSEQSREELVKQLQIQQMQVVQAALMSGDDPDRRVFTNTVAISAEGADLILERVESFRRALRSIVQQDPAPQERVLQISLSLIPLLKKASR
ncbi:MAG: TIGR02147 family protein [Fibrobacteres bacterium]|nr:TIGR02147 family protein [Fibrobacterota bacterium]